MTGLTDANVQFGLIPNDHWVQPHWINETRASAARDKMIKDNVIYGGIVSGKFIDPLLSSRFLIGSVP